MVATVLRGTAIAMRSLSKTLSKYIHIYMFTCIFFKYAGCICSAQETRIILFQQSQLLDHARQVKVQRLFPNGWGLDRAAGGKRCNVNHWNHLGTPQQSTIHMIVIDTVMFCECSWRSMAGNLHFIDSGKYRKQKTDFDSPNCLWFPKLIVIPQTDCDFEKLLWFWKLLVRLRTDCDFDLGSMKWTCAKTRAQCLMLLLSALPSRGPTAPESIKHSKQEQLHWLKYWQSAGLWSSLPIDDHALPVLDTQRQKNQTNW